MNQQKLSNLSWIVEKIYEQILLFILKYLGRKNYKKFEQETKKAARVQQKLLKQILQLQKNTEYGKNYNFAALKTSVEFQNIHPLSTYENYRNIIENISQNGKFDRLTSEPITLFQETSATTGKSKLIPSTKRLSLSFQKVVQAVSGFTEAYYLEKKAVKKSYRGLTFSNAQPLKLTPSGIPRGTGSSGGLRQSKFIQTIIRLRYTSPPSVFLISNYQSAYYCHWLFGLLEPELDYIMANFASNFLQGLQLLESNWQKLLQDIESGKINESLKLDAATREELQSLLQPNPVRAKELTTEFEKGMRGILPRIFPKLSYIQCVTTGSMELYQEQLQFYTGDVPLYSPAYIASEACIGINVQPERKPPAYVIAPGAAFFEFIPIAEVDKDTPNSVDLTSLSVGESYEIVVTTLSGLYRYRLGDAIECIDYYNQSPVIKFLYRQGSLLNLTGEKVSENTVFVAVTEAIKLLGESCQLVDYTTNMELISNPGRYAVYVEVSPIPESLPNLRQYRDKVEENISDLNQFYLMCREANRIAQLKLKLVKKDTFKILKNKILGDRTSDAQFKMPRLLKNSEQIDWIETQVIHTL